MNDKNLQHAVEEELEWAGHVDASHIQVAVHDGVVQLSGFVRSLSEKKAANRNVRHLHGVLGVRDDIEVRPPETHRHPDEEIARRARQVFLWDSLIPSAQIEVDVKNGVVILTGTLELAYQRAEAERRVQQLAGVVCVDNQIVVRPVRQAEAHLRDMVVRALDRHSDLDVSHIAVDVRQGRVELSGAVPSFTQRLIAENAAWAAPGVGEVVNLIGVRSRIDR